MPSHLRLQASFEPFEANASYQTSPTSPAAKKQKMSLTQTYYVASTARSKLGKEASKADHNLRLLVGHANMLDTLMAELADAEREQEAWFNQSVKKAAKPEEPRHIQWVDTIEEDPMEDDSDSDDGSDYEEDEEMFNVPLRKIRSPPITFSSVELAEDEEDEEEDDVDTIYDEDDDEDMPSLTRAVSKHSPPELTHDSDSDSEDESMPPSPETSTIEFSEKERQAITTTTFYDAKSQQGLEDYIMQHVQQPQAPLIAAY